MKIQLLNSLLLRIGLCFFISACTSRIVNIPTCAYCYDENQDSSVIENHSISLDSLRILFISLTDDSTTTQIDSLFDNAILTRKRSGVRVMDSHATSSGMETASIEGTLQNQFLNLSYLRVIRKLQEITDIFILNKKSGKIGRNQLDSIIRQLDIDFIITANTIIYNTKEEVTHSSHPVDPYVISYAQVSYATSNNNWSGQMCIQYKSKWDLLWLEKETKKVKKKIQIVQTGQYWDSAKGKMFMEGIFACALKASDDFVNLFKRSN